MKAIIYRNYGGPEVLETVEIPTPEPGAGEILVRVRASSVNPVDWKIASGKYRPILSANFPQVPGFDMAGEVVRCGSGVSGFAEGDRVHARLADDAATAEFAVATPEVTTLMPETMNFATAAGLPLAGMTALQGLRDKGGMPLQGAHQRVLVIGASGGVGHFAVQIAHAAGARVIGVCSGRNTDLVKSLGADEVIDYGVDNPYRDLEPCDIIFDCVGQSVADWLPHLKDDGCFVSTLPSPAQMLHGLNPFSDKKAKSIILESNAADLGALDDLFTAGRVHVVMDQFPMEQMRTAWEKSIEGRTVGKIVIDIE
ncbi:MAG: NAD(P)-dependent alcohol dehydrogenase [Chthoniobacteraceae bacterium]